MYNEVSTFLLVEKFTVEQIVLRRQITQINVHCTVYSEQRKGTLFRNIQNTGRCNYTALGSREVPIYWLGSYVLIFLPFLIIS